MNKIIYIFFYIFLQSNLLANSNINLSIEEKEWIEKNPSIKIGIDKNFAPFEFIDKDGNFKGVTADYLKEMEKILNLKFEIIKTKSWNEIINMTQDKSIDVLSCIVETDQRKEYLDFIDPYLSFPMVIVTNKTIGFINGLKDLKGKTVAVIEGYTPQHILEKNYKDIHLVKTVDLKQSLELVATGKTYAHVGNLSRVAYLLKEEGFHNLSISGITKYKYHFTMGIKKDAPILKSIIQKSFNAIPKKIKNDIYYKWFPTDYKQSKDYSLIWEISIFASLLILFFVIWMYKLKKEINRRKLIEAQLKRNTKWLNSSLKTANIGAWSWDLRTNTITGNSVYASILGLSEEEIKIPANVFQKKFIHKEDRPYVMKELEDYFGKVVKSCSAKFRIHSKDGKTKMIESNGEIFQYDSFNNPAIMIGFIKEIKD